jgi:hypothetical protein
VISSDIHSPCKKFSACRELDVVREFVCICVREKTGLSIEGTTIGGIAICGTVWESESTCFVPSDMAGPCEPNNHFEGQRKASCPGLPQVEHL